MKLAGPTASSTDSVVLTAARPRGAPFLQGHRLELKAIFENSFSCFSFKR